MATCVVTLARANNHDTVETLIEAVDEDKYLDAIEVDGMVLAVERATPKQVYAELSVVANVAETAIAILGKGNKVQVLVFDTDGLNSNMTPDHTNDHITCTIPGTYRAMINIHADSIAGAGAGFGFSIYKNNGATEFANVHAHEDFLGGGGEAAGIPLSGLVTLALNDTLELWVWNETNAQNIIVTDCTFSLERIGP